MATGFETLLGYLFIKGDNDRILTLIRKGFDDTGLLDIRPSDREETNK